MAGMKHLLKPRRAMFLTAAFVGLLTPPHALRADEPATQPAAAVPSTQPADSADVKEVRQQMLEWDADLAKMSLADFRKTFHTENDREAEYADFLAHDTWEAGKTEQAVRDKWGADADQQFCRLVGFTTREEDATCTIKVDGNHAVASWDNIKDMKPEKMIKVDGHWQSDVHAMWDDWIAENPNMETDKNPIGKKMKQARDDIAAGKFDDADSFVGDLKAKMQAPDAN
jgi:hypothetical protein